MQNNMFKNAIVIIFYAYIKNKVSGIAIPMAVSTAPRRLIPFLPFTINSPVIAKIISDAAKVSANQVHIRLALL